MFIYLGTHTLVIKKWRKTTVRDMIYGKYWREEIKIYVFNFHGKLWNVN